MYVFWNKMHNGIQGHSRGHWFWCQTKEQKCSFLLVINCNLGPILSPLRDKTCISAANNHTTPYFAQNMRMFLLDWISDLGAPKSTDSGPILHIITKSNLCDQCTSSLQTARNTLPVHVQSSPSISTFRQWLKTFLFQQSFPDILTLLTMLSWTLKWLLLF